MNYDLKGELGIVKDRLECLHEANIAVNMNDGKFQFGSYFEAYRGYSYLHMKGLMSDEEYMMEMEKIESMKDKETIQLLENFVRGDMYDIEQYEDDNIVGYSVAGKTKSLTLAKVSGENYPSYILNFMNNIDDEIYNKTKVIPFYFEKGTDIYDAINNFALSSKEIIRGYNKYVDIKHDDKGLYFNFVTVKQNKDDSFETSNAIVVNPYDRSYTPISNLFNELENCYNMSKGNTK